MNLGSDRRQNIQMELDFSSTPAGEAREAGEGETASLPVVREPGSPASLFSKSADVTTRIAVYGPVRTVVWQGSVGDRRPYADRCVRWAGPSACRSRHHFRPLA